MRDQEKILLFVVAFLICKGQQQCDKRWPWVQYVDGLYCALGSYQFQQNRSNFNVTDLNNWGKGGKQGIYITKENHKTFLAILSQHKLCLDQSEELTASQIEDLNNLLEIALRNVSKIECRDDTLRVTGTFLKFSDLPSGDQCDGRDVKRIEIFAADTFYADQDYTNSKENLHMSIMAPSLIPVGNYTINLSYGDFLGLAENIVKTPNRVWVKDNERYGRFSHFTQNGVDFIEKASDETAFWSAKVTAANFLTALKNFKFFLGETLTNRFLQNRVRGFLTKMTTNPRTTANLNLSDTSFTLTYEFFKNMMLLSKQLQLPLENERALADTKIAKTIEIMNFTKNHKFEDNKLRSLVVDMNGFVASIIDNLEGLDQAYSVPILKRMENLKTDNDVRKVGLLTIRRQRKKLGRHLLDLAESDLNLIGVVDVEVKEAVIYLESVIDAATKKGTSPSDAKNFRSYLRVKSLVEIVGKVAILLSSIPLTLKLTKSDVDKNYLQGIRILLNETFPLCDKVTELALTYNKPIFEENDFCDTIRPMINAAGELAAYPVGNYSDLNSVFYQFDVEGFLKLVRKFASKIYVKQINELERPLYALKAALERAIEISDVVQKFHRLLRLENYVVDLMSLGYGEAIVKGLLKLEKEHDDGNNNIFISSADRRANAVEIMETVKAIDAFSKSQVIALEYNNFINGIKQYSFPLAHLYIADYDLQIDGNSESMSVAQMVRRFRNDIWQSKDSFKYDELKIFPVEFGAENPFYTWNDQRSISDLLKGKEVIFAADIQKSDKTLDAIKFSKIDLIFEMHLSPTVEKIYKGESRKWAFALTHLGDSKFNCNGKIYTVATPTQKFMFRLTPPLLPNSVHTRISYGDYVLSPYASWKIQIIGLDVAVAKSFLEFAQNSTLRLVGTAQYYKGGSDLCSENLDKYYERADGNELLQSTPEVPSPSRPLECPER